MMWDSMWDNADKYVYLGEHAMQGFVSGTPARKQPSVFIYLGNIFFLLYSVD